jgi:hypothetical protein
VSEGEEMSREEDGMLSLERKFSFPSSTQSCLWDAGIGQHEPFLRGWQAMVGGGQGHDLAPSLVDFLPSFPFL